VFDPSAQNLGWLALALVVIVAVAVTLHRWLAR
jgi:hypothetical protein